MTFYDEEVTLNGSDYTTTVTYADAEDASVDFNVKNGVVVTISDEVALSKDEDVTYTGTIYGSDGKGYSFSLTQKAAGDDATLVSTQSRVQVVEDEDAGTGTIAILGGGPATIEALKNAVKTFDENATVVWAFTSATGETVNEVNAGASTNDYAKITATVTAEDGTTKIVYTLGAITYTYTKGDVSVNGNVDTAWSITSVTGDSSDDELTVTVERTGNGVAAKDRTWTVKLDGEELGTVATTEAINQNDTVTLSVPACYADGTITVELAV